MRGNECIQYEFQQREHNFVRKKALIIGLHSQDGQYLLRLLTKKGYEVWGTTRSLSEELTNDKHANTITERTYCRLEAFMRTAPLSQESGINKSDIIWPHHWTAERVAFEEARRQRRSPQRRSGQLSSDPGDRGARLEAGDQTKGLLKHL